MGVFLSVRALHEEGATKKAIARSLGIDVRTVRKYLRRIEQGANEPRRAVVSSKLDAFGDLIAQKVEMGLSAVQIHQDLSELPDFSASYETVKRRVRGLRREDPEVYCRMRYGPGEEAQIDFGDIGRLPVEGRSRRVYLFVMTLCYSRMAYYELVTDQRVPSFLGAIRRAFEFFGGVPERIKPDNLRSAVLIDALGQRYYQEDFFRFCTHYGTVPDAARIRMPTDKGRTERDIGYAKGNAFRGREFDALTGARDHLQRWRDRIANVRIHGTTRRRPVDLFEAERLRLRPLPEDPFEIAEWGRYRVRKDCHIHVRSSYYSVPFRLVGDEVLVRLSEETITAYHDGEIVAHHPRTLAAGTDVTDPEHYPPTKRISSHEIHRRRLLNVRGAGSHASALVHELRRGPWVFGDQLARLDRLLEMHGAEALDQAAERALYFGAIDGAKRIERILTAGLQSQPLPNRHRPAAVRGDFGRALAEYDQLLPAGVEVGV